MTMNTYFCQQCEKKMPAPYLMPVCNPCLDKIETDNQKVISRSPQNHFIRLIDDHGFDEILRLMSDYASEVADRNAGKGGSIGSRRCFNKISGLIALTADQVERLCEQSHN